MTKINFITSKDQKSRALIRVSLVLAHRHRRSWTGVTAQQVVENTGFALIIPSNASQNELPTAEELRVLRTEVDPQRLLAF